MDGKNEPAVLSPGETARPGLVLSLRSGVEHLHAGAPGVAELDELDDRGLRVVVGAMRTSSCRTHARRLSVLALTLGR